MWCWLMTHLAQVRCGANHVLRDVLSSHHEEAKPPRQVGWFCSITQTTCDRSRRRCGAGTVFSEVECTFKIHSPLLSTRGGFLTHSSCSPPGASLYPK